MPYRPDKERHVYLRRYLPFCFSSLFLVSCSLLTLQTTKPSCLIAPSRHKYLPVFVLPKDFYKVDHSFMLSLKMQVWKVIFMSTKSKLIPTNIYRIIYCLTSKERHLILISLWVEYYTFSMKQISTTIGTFNRDIQSLLNPMEIWWHNLSSIDNDTGLIKFELIVIH